MKGYFQIYSGKGKTTAAIGPSLPAAGAGLSVLIAQFIKGLKYSEIGALQRFDDLITVGQYGRDCFLKRKAADADCALAQEGVRKVVVLLDSCTFNLVVLDTICIARKYELVTLEQVLALIHTRAENCEIVASGRYAPGNYLMQPILSLK